jgi:hypothetical protein
MGLPGPTVGRHDFDGRHRRLRRPGRDAHNNNGLLNSSVFDNVSASFLARQHRADACADRQPDGQCGPDRCHHRQCHRHKLPAATLTFSLLSAPASATLNQINNTNAAFSWRPQVTDASTINPVTLKVTDNGSPSLSATQSFTITVNPLALPTVPSVGWNNGQFTLLVTNSIVGPDYAVQASSNLVNWSTLFITNSPPTNSFQWTDTNALTLPVQFYRIKIGPPLP